MHHEKVAEVLRREITTGTPPSGQKLDSEAALCRRLRVGIESLRRALQQLRDEHVIYTVSGRGSYVGDAREIGTPEKVAQGFRDDIASGALAPGQQLESLLELSRVLSTRREVVRQAFGILRAENLIYTVHRVGSFVADATPEHTAPDDVRVLREERQDLERRAEAETETAILTGGYQPGEKLPGAAELAARYDISTVAAEAVYARLQDKGVVHSIRTAGTFAGPDTRPCSQRQFARRGLLHDIRAGSFPLGSLIPLTHDLAKRYCVNVVIMTAVIGELLGERVLEMGRGNRAKVPNTVKNQPEPTYGEIAAEIRDQIRKGTLKPGQIVESRRELAHRKRVSLCTAQRAIAQLEQEGFVKSLQRKGTFVTGSKPQFPAPVPPPYMRVANDIVHDIEIGLLKPGDMLLTGIELAEFYGVSTVTISRAFGVLHEKALIRFEPSVGTFIADGVVRDSRPQHVIAREGLVRDLDAGVFPVGGRLPNNEELAARYGVGKKAITRVLHALRDRGIVHMYSHQPVTVLRKPG